MNINQLKSTKKIAEICCNRKVKVLWDSGEESDHPIRDTGEVGDLHVS
jgi:hypothetical protein